MSSPLTYLAGDIGGTKSWMALVSVFPEGGWNIEYSYKYPNTQFQNVRQLIETCLSDADTDASQISGLSLAAAGPVANGYCRMTNLDWEIDTAQIKSHFDFCHVTLINDFHAVAQGVTLVNDKALLALNDVVPDSNGLKVVTGAGTGLGLAWLQQGSAQSTEGSHTGFAPADAEQYQLLQELRSSVPYISWEDLLSGTGLERLYRFVSADRRLPAEDITAAAEQGDESATAAVGLFWRIFANWAGNLALFYRPVGGIYLAGGVTNKLLPMLDREEFISAYCDKGDMRSLVETTAVFVVTDEQIGLLGAIAQIRHGI
jgi:glucokinase